MYSKIKDIIRKKYGLEVSEIEKNLDSTEGNVYILKTSKCKYIIKVYSELSKVNSMTKLHTDLSEILYVPKIIKTVDGKMYVEFDEKYFIIYSYLEGIQISTYFKEYKNYDINIIKALAKELRKMHDATVNKELYLEKIKFANNLTRKSVLHFDLTKDNIFVNNEKVGFIDFDDAKYGDSVCDIAILLCFLFISKSKGVDKRGAKIFLDSYYNEIEKELKEEELNYIEKYTREWIQYLIDGHEFDSSLKCSFEFKKDKIKQLLKLINEMEENYDE